MAATKPSLAYGVVRSPSLAAAVRRHRASCAKASKANLGAGLSFAAIISIALWIAAGAGAHLVIAMGIRLATKLPLV